ncbi:phospholipid carrier-dependent glycosyltransferase [Hymenobacter oligotrophus]|uniref:Phospholipid carrier-dependent glycosyltransferase n=1 Tax=Hymenobacter oligotrophus TaxID=2319843 RepID=A0A3B7QZG0_9BACT|nr:glycosyltransferase family 39 protein [Hymenobacter oligotrophus]AYA36390.1 phospholipid carrier-dependent glycosyltransferase [Hymenobacter oligotrophus]
MSVVLPPIAHRRVRVDALLLGLALCKFLLQFLLSGRYGLHRDEYLYLDMAHHLAWGYKEIPPLLAPFSWLAQAVLGHTIWAAKFFPALFGSLTVLLTGLIVRQAGGGRWAQVAAAVAVAVSPVYLAMHGLFQPNFLDVFFWTLYGFLVVRFVHTHEPRLLLALGVCIGLGMLAKYTTAFYVASLLLALLLTPAERPWLATRWFWLAVGAAALIFLPNLVWQATHNWPVLGHMNKLQETQLTNVSPIDFLVEQLPMTLAGAGLWLAGLWFCFTRAGKPYRPLALAYFFVIALLLLSRGKNYYAAAVYPPLMALGAVYLERKSRAALAGTLGIGLLLSLPIVPALLPVLSIDGLSRYVQRVSVLDALTRWEDGQQHHLPQDVADMHGWDEYAPLVQQALARLTPAERAHCIVYGDNYGQAGALNWYGPALGLPRCYTLNGSNSYWMPAPETVSAFIYANEGYGPEDLKQVFGSMEVVGRVQSPYARIRGSEVLLFRQPKTDLGPFVQKRITEAQQGFE